MHTRILLSEKKKMMKVLELFGHSEGAMSSAALEGQTGLAVEHDISFCFRQEDSRMQKVLCLFPTN